MRSRGAKAPTFELPAVDGDDGTTGRRRLSDALDDGPAVVTFYVFDFHPRCTEHVCDLANLEWVDVAADVTTFAVSTDRVFSHRAFARAEGLDLTILADSDGRVAESFGVLYDEFAGHSRIAKRSVFVIDTDRTISYAWSTDDPAVQPDWPAVAAVVRALVGPSVA
jgi:peroxiredoxin